MKVELVTKTVGVGSYEGLSIDEITVGQARVSTSKSGDSLFDKPEVLIRHLLLQGHFSPFDMANLGFDIVTSRAMSLEFIRHFSIKPQQFSQRYSKSTEMEYIELREQSLNNRQSSTNTIYDSELQIMVDETIEKSRKTYESLVNNNVAKEVARFVLPETATTRLYMNGSIRSWITFLNARLHKTAQKEIRILAYEIRDCLIKECPIISSALYNFENSYNVHILDRLILEKYGVYKNEMSD